MPARLTKWLARLPHNQKRVLKVLRYLPADLWNQLINRSTTSPPRWLRFDSESSFEDVGKHLLALCIEYGQLNPADNVLDIGCGVGRLALPLTGYLAPDSNYEGFDVDQRAIAWCNKAISTSHPNFRFQHVAVSNEHYNPKSRTNARSFEFPYARNSFRFAVATSLFTHLRTDDARQYLLELGRVLSPGGHAVLTWYAMDEAGSRDDRTTTLDFRHQIDDFAFTDNPKNPTAAIAFTTTFIIQAIAESGLAIVGDIHAGTWRDEHGPTYQDLVVVQKPAS